MALPRAAPPNWPDVEALPIVHCSFGKCQGETKGDYHSDDDQNRGGGKGVEVAVHALLDRIEVADVGHTYEPLSE